jgi:hypothetical protein
MTPPRNRTRTGAGPDRAGPGRPRQGGPVHRQTTIPRIRTHVPGGLDFDGDGDEDGDGLDAGEEVDGLGVGLGVDPAGADVVVDGDISGDGRDDACEDGVGRDFEPGVAAVTIPGLVPPLWEGGCRPGGAPAGEFSRECGLVTAG